jgi:hypothetical protein
MRRERDVFRLPVVLSALILVAGTFVAASGLTGAEFSGTTTNPTSFSAQRIFTAERSMSTWDLRDASTGVETDQTDPFGDPDGRASTSAEWPDSFAADRYLELEFAGPLPASLSTSGVVFEYGFRSDGGNACYYLEVQRRSTGTVLGTHGSASEPVACSTDTVGWTRVSTPIPEVGATDVANDMRIRIYGMSSLGSSTETDRGTVSGSTPYAAFTLHRRLLVDQADGTPSAQPWPLSESGDGATYTSSTGWDAGFDPARYLQFRFPAYVPTGATVTSATLYHTYRSIVPGTETCYYMEVYSGDTLIGTHGSVSTPISCNSQAVFQSDSVALPEIDTIAESNAVSVRMYIRNGGLLPSDRASEHDHVVLTLRYGLD